MAVPTWTARAPQQRNSRASSPVMMPPMPTTGMRTARASSWTMRSATGLMAGPERPPLPAARRGRRASRSIAVARRVLMAVSASAPSASAARPTRVMSPTLGESFTQSGARTRARTARTIAARACGSVARMPPHSGRFGLEAFSSRATTPGAPSSRAAHSANSSGLSPQKLATTRAPAARSAGRRSPRKASTPMFWRPIELSMPPGVSTRRGAGVPGEGRSERPFTASAPPRPPRPPPPPARARAPARAARDGPRRSAGGPRRSPASGRCSRSPAAGERPLPPPPPGARTGSRAPSRRRRATRAAQTSGARCRARRAGPRAACRAGLRAAARERWPRSPPHERRAPGEAGAEGREADERARPDAPLLDGLVQRDRDRRRGRVAVALDVVEHLLLGQLEAHRHQLADTQVRLVRDQEVQVGGGAAVVRERLPDHLGKARDGVLEDVAPLHARPEAAAGLVEHVLGHARPHAARGRLDHQLLGVPALAVEVDRKDAAAPVGLGPEHGGARAVAEDDRHP